MLGIFVFFHSSTKTIETRYGTWMRERCEKKLCTPSLEWLDVSPESLHSTPLKNQPIFVLIATSASNKRVSAAHGRKEEMRTRGDEAKERQNEKLVVHMWKAKRETRRGAEHKNIFYKPFFERNVSSQQLAFRTNPQIQPRNLNKSYCTLLHIHRSARSPLAPFRVCGCLSLIRIRVMCERM